jgi:ABC-type glutathione transport system ATPase component
MADAVISLESVTKTYFSRLGWARSRICAVRSINLTIDDGETLALVGESGSGKTTLGRLCLGLTAPSSGRVLFDGEQFSKLRGRLRGRLSAVLQHPQSSLNPRLRVGTSVVEPLMISGQIPRQAARQRAVEILARVGLSSSYAERYPHELSGGQQQRVAIARALVTTPRFIVFDEAVSALDVSVQAQVLNLIKDLQQQIRFSALFITHDLAAARYVAGRVAVMFKGEIVDVVQAIQLYQVTSHPYTRELQQASGLELTHDGDPATNVSTAIIEVQS